MPMPTHEERITFREHVACGDGPFGEVLRAMLWRLEHETSGIGGPVRVERVRRLSPGEVERLRLVPVTTRWFEVAGDARVTSTEKKGHTDDSRAGETNRAR
jgi:hypothetical protein